MSIKHLNIKELAKFFNVAEVTARVWCQRGLFPNAFQNQTPFGSYWLVPIKDVNEFKRPKAGRPFEKEKQAA